MSTMFTNFVPVTPITHVDQASQLGVHQPSDDVVCMHDVSFAYDARPAISHVTLHVRRGNTLGVIGPNGGGKSTLMKLMLGVLNPDSGSVTILARPPEEACRDGSQVGYVPQRHAIDWTFPISVRQVVQLGRIGKKKFFSGFSRSDKDAVTEALSAVDMLPLADQPIGGLSGGQQQRVFIARALIAKPQILFLDEPTTGIDQHGQEKFAALLDSLKKKFGLTLVMVTHDLRAAVATCDRVACLNRTLHYHDHPNALSRDVLFKVFQCDLDAVLDHTATPEEACGCGDHDHSHGHQTLLTPPKR